MAIKYRRSTIMDDVGRDGGDGPHGPGPDIDLRRARMRSYLLLAMALFLVASLAGVRVLLMARVPAAWEGSVVWREPLPEGGAEVGVRFVDADGRERVVHGPVRDPRRVAVEVGDRVMVEPYPASDADSPRWTWAPP